VSEWALCVLLSYETPTKMPNSILEIHKKLDRDCQNAWCSRIFTFRTRWHQMWMCCRLFWYTILLRNQFLREADLRNYCMSITLWYPVHVAFFRVRLGFSEIPSIELGFILSFSYVCALCLYHIQFPINTAYARALPWSCCKPLLASNICQRKLLNLCRRFGLQKLERHLCTQIGVQQRSCGNVGNAICWFLRAENVSQIAALCELVVDQFVANRSDENLQVRTWFAATAIFGTLCVTRCIPNNAQLCKSSFVYEMITAHCVWYCYVIANENLL